MERALPTQSINKEYQATQDYIARLSEKLRNTTESSTRATEDWSGSFYVDFHGKMSQLD